MSVSSGFSGGKQEQKIDIARNRGRLCSLQTTENAERFLLKDDNGKLWVIIWKKYRDLSVASRSIIDHLVFQDVNKWYYHSMQIVLPFHWPTAHHVTCK